MKIFVTVLVCLCGFDVAAMSMPGPRRENQQWLDVSSQWVYAKRWQKPVIRTGEYRQSDISMGNPAVSVARGHVYIATADGDIEARSITTGEIVWRRLLKTPFASALGLVKVGGIERLLVGGLSGSFSALDPASGETSWEIALKGLVLAPPTAWEDMIFLQTSQGRVVAVAGDTGETRWSLNGPEPRGLTIYGHSGITVCGDRVVTGYVDGSVSAYEAKTGTALWTRRISGEGEFRDVDATPVCSDDRVYTASYSDGVVAMALDDGRVTWRLPQRAVVAMALDGERVIAVSAEGVLLLLNASDGHKLVRTSFASGPISILHVHRGTIAFAAGDNGLLVFDAKEGKPLQASFLGSRIEGGMGADGDVLSVLVGNGTLALFRLGGVPEIKKE